MWHLRLLGGVSIEGEKGDPGATVARRHPLALLSLLATAPSRTLTRDRAIGLLWPGLTDRRARNRLRSTLYLVRRELGPEAVLSAGDDLRLNSEVVRADVAEFEEALARADPERAVSLYAGPFLDGFYLNGSGEFERWAERERRRLARRHEEALEALALKADAAGDSWRAALWWRRLARERPHSGRVVVRLMEALAAAGERAEALERARAHERLMREEYGAEPSRAVTALARRLREAPAPVAAADNTRPAGPARTRPRPEPSAAEPRQPPPVPSRAAPASAPPKAEPGKGKRNARRAARRAWAASLLATGLLALVAALGSRREGGASTHALVETVDARRVLVAPFENLTGDPALDPLGRMAADWVATGLLETGVVEVVGPAEVVRWAREAERTDPDPNVELAALEAAGHARSGLLLSGSAVTRGAEVEWEARLTEVPTGQLVRTVAVTAGPAEEPMDAVARLRRRVLGALATVVDERFASWAGAARPPPSFRAYRHFSDALDLQKEGRFEEAADRFLAAAEDSSFAAALLWGAWAHLSDFFATTAIHEQKRARADSLLRLLEDRRQRLSAWEAAMLDHHVATARFDQAAAYEALGRAVKLAPDLEWQLRRVTLAVVLDRPREALETLEGIGSDPEWLGRHAGRYWSLKARALHRLGEYEKELALAQRLLSANPSDRAAGWLEFRANAGLGRSGPVEEWVRVNGWHRGLAGELSAHGYEELANNVTEVRLAELDTRPDSARDEEWHYERGVVLGELERFEESRLHLERIGPESPRHLDAVGELGWVLANLGEREEALRLSDVLERIDEEAWRLLLQARIAAALGERDRAVRLLARMSIRGFLHQELEFESLRGYAPFERLQRPRG